MWKEKDFFFFFNLKKNQSTYMGTGDIFTYGSVLLGRGWGWGGSSLFIGSSHNRDFDCFCSFL